MESEGRWSTSYNAVSTLLSRSITTSVDDNLSFTFHNNLNNEDNGYDMGSWVIPQRLQTLLQESPSDIIADIASLFIQENGINDSKGSTGLISCALPTIRVHPPEERNPCETFSDEASEPDQNLNENESTVAYNIPPYSENEIDESNTSNGFTTVPSNANQSHSPVEVRHDFTTVFCRLTESFYKEAFLWIYSSVLLNPAQRRTKLKLHALAICAGCSLQQAACSVLSGYLNGFRFCQRLLVSDSIETLRQTETRWDAMTTGGTVEGMPSCTLLASRLRQLSVNIGLSLNASEMLTAFEGVVSTLTSGPFSTERCRIFHKDTPVHDYSQLDNLINANSSSVYQQSLRNIPSAPPPYPGFFLHFLSCLTERNDGDILGQRRDNLLQQDHIDSAIIPVEEESTPGLDEKQIELLCAYEYSSVTTHNMSDVSLMDNFLPGNEESRKCLEEDLSSHGNEIKPANSSKVTAVQDIGKSCSICLEKYGQKDMVIALPCCHIYHRVCIFRWLQVKGSCPVCRLDIATRLSDESLKSQS